jgi:hypothetical protein
MSTLDASLLVVVRGSRTRRSTPLLFAGLALVAACGYAHGEPSGDAGTDGGFLPSDDAGDHDSGGRPPGVRGSVYYLDPVTGEPRSLPTPDVGATADSAAGSGAMADGSCFGANVRPSETAPDVAVTLSVSDFQERRTIAGLPVQLFRSNELPAPVVGGFPCPSALCQAATTDADGTASPFADADGSWYASFIPAQMGATPSTTVVDTAEFNARAGTPATTWAMSQATLSILPVVWGLTRQANTGFVLGVLQDCAGQPMRGLVVRMFEEDADPTTASGDTLIEDRAIRTEPGYRYFDGTGFPNGAQPFTSVDGLFAGLTIPAGASVRVEAWWQSPTGPQLWGCERIRVLPNGATFVNLRPLRADITGCTPPL